MTAIDILRFRPANDAAAADQLQVGDRADPPGGVLAAVNAVILSGEQMRAAVGAIQHVQVRSAADVRQHAMLLTEFAEDHNIVPRDYAGPALQARAIAMDRWCQRHDPDGQTDIAAFFEAGARCPLVEADHGLGFDPDAFRDLVNFITNLPF